ncbi:hypothetical protein [Paenibacillus eucommiae]|uniref:GTPase SAR1 family protein n=1 Tax=Paenibacillus eucommiae TaxID=1355755 RepID=A0ABS4IW59_9BACL|nr:hypothetical protein [Paenibacillus eucommiae]MBP1991833.1 GTPase SAR1 family protein [Paenibacillus eucommiae]
MAYKQTERPNVASSVDVLPSHSFGSKVNLTREQDRLYEFIQARLLGPNGVYTNYEDTDQSSEVATGHEVLSESASLQLRYATLTKQKPLFDQVWALAKETFDLKTGFSYRYSPKQDKTYTVNAAVDDLRIIRALYEAGQAFANSAYTKKADKYGKRFYSNNVKDGYVHDFYDEAYRMANSSITLCYIDLKTLGMLPVSNGKRQKMLEQMRTIVQNGYISDEFPFYEARFHYDTDDYASGPIHTVESLLTILHLAEVKQAKPESISYLKEHVQAGTLFGQYTKEGVPANSIQSTAIYAITAMIGSEIGDYSLYEQSIQRMNAFQVEQSDSPFYGGFGDTDRNQAYSFDNLMALLAYSY